MVLWCGCVCVMCCGRVVCVRLCVCVVWFCVRACGDCVWCGFVCVCVCVSVCYGVYTHTNLQTDHFHISPIGLTLSRSLQSLSTSEFYRFMEPKCHSRTVYSPSVVPTNAFHTSSHSYPCLSFPSRSVHLLNVAQPNCVFVSVALK